MAKYDTLLLAYPVTTPHHCLDSRNPYSAKCLNLYIARPYSSLSLRLLLSSITGAIPCSVAAATIYLSTIYL